MADQTRVSGTVNVEPTSKEFVAFQLLDRIARNEKVADGEREKREYWLTLYRQCYKVANGEGISYVLDRTEK